jgi:hypothetical protein
LESQAVYKLYTRIQDIIPYAQELDAQCLAILRACNPNFDDDAELLDGMTSRQSPKLRYPLIYSLVSGTMVTLLLEKCKVFVDAIPDGLLEEIQRIEGDPRPVTQDHAAYQGEVWGRVYFVLQKLRKSARSIACFIRLDDRQGYFKRTYNAANVIFANQLKGAIQGLESDKKFQDVVTELALSNAETAKDLPSRDAEVAVRVATTEAEGRPFSGGEIVFTLDRVEICGVDICSGPRCRSKRVVLELLSRRKDGSFTPYSGEELEAEAKHNGVKGTAAGWIRDLRDDIMERLRTETNIISGREDVILSGDRGYRFAESLTVRFIDPGAITDITDTVDVPDVLDDDVRDVLDVRDNASGARRAWILDELAHGKQLRAAAVVGKFKCSKKTALRDFGVLKDQGKIEFTGEARTGHYRMC